MDVISDRSIFEKEYPLLAAVDRAASGQYYTVCPTKTLECKVLKDKSVPWVTNWYHLAEPCDVKQ